MINVVDRMSKECFDEVLPVFEARQDGFRSSEDAHAAIHEILTRYEVEAPDSLAFFIASVANGLAHEPVNPEEKKWYKKRDGLWIHYGKAMETSKAL